MAKNDPHFDPLVAKNIDLTGVPNTAYAAVGAISRYLQTTHKTSMDHIKKVLPYITAEYMVIGEATKRNLELTETISDASRRDCTASVST